MQCKQVKLSYDLLMLNALAGYTDPAEAIARIADRYQGHQASWLTLDEIREANLFDKIAGFKMLNGQKLYKIED